MKRLLVALLFAASPVVAQTVTRAEFDSLKAEVAKMRREVGPYGDSIPPAANFPARCPELPNGRYSVWCRASQIGTGIDGNNVAVAGIAQRLAAVEAQPGQGGQIIAPYTQGSNIVVPGKICVGGPCDPYRKQMVQILGQGDAEILFQANKSGQNPQGAATHEHVVGAQADGGFRVEFNWLCDTAGICKWIEQDKPRMIWGFDSRGTLSLSDDHCVNGVCTIEPSQTMVFRIDRANLIAAWTLMKANWRWGSGTSTVTNGFDKLYLIPQQ